MRRFSQLSLVALTTVALSACGGATPGTAPINVGQVLDRTVKTLVNFDAYLRRYDYKKVDQAMFNQFNMTFQHDLNAAPRFHPTKILTTLRKDASVLGYGDLNGNGKIDEKEPRLFRMELDADNNRVIITAAANGNAVGRPMRGSGFLTGVLVGSILNRQTRAGVKPGHFNARKVAGAPAITRKVAKKGGSRARSAARSGGTRSGK